MSILCIETDKLKQTNLDEFLDNFAFFYERRQSKTFLLVYGSMLTLTRFDDL